MAAKLTALLGSCVRHGRWKIATRTKAVVILGHSYVDYRDAYVDPETEQIKLTVLCVLGSATFIVPEGSDVQPSVVSLLASTAFDVPEVDVEPRLPTMAIDSTTLLGRCRILTTPPDELDDEVDRQDGGQEGALGLVDDLTASVPGPVDEIGSARFGEETRSTA